MFKGRAMALVERWLAGATGTGAIRTFALGDGPGAVQQAIGGVETSVAPTRPPEH